jgi:preprotein translocase SecE subunit
MAAFWVLLLFIVYGCLSLRYALDGIGWLPVSFKSSLASIPVVGDLTINVMIAYFLVPVGSAFFLHTKLNQPKYADFLIETEQELRKVHWPTFNETKSASIVVIVCVLVLAGILFGADYLFGNFFRRLF